MATKKELTFAQRVKKTSFTDVNQDAHRALAEEDVAAWRAAVLELDGFAEAAKQGATGLMALMLELGASPDARPPDKGRVNSTPPALMQVIRSVAGDALSEWVARLLAAGANASLQHPDPRLINPVISRVSLQTPLAWALQTAPLSVVEMLWTTVTDARVRVSAIAYAMGELFVTAGAPGFPDTVPDEARRRFATQLLTEVDVNTTTVDGRTLLHVACALRSLDAVKALLAAGANPNAACEREWTVTYTRVVIPVGATPIAVLQAHNEAHKNVTEIREVLIASGTDHASIERKRPAWAAASGALLDALFPSEDIAAAFRKLPPPTDPFSYLLGMSKALPPPERLARFAETNTLAYLLYKPRFAPHIGAPGFEEAEEVNPRSGQREWTKLLKRSSFARDGWAVLEQGSILSYLPGPEGSMDALALARLPESEERLLVRVSTSAVSVVGRCEPLCLELMEQLKQS